MNISYNYRRLSNSARLVGFLALFIFSSTAHKLSAQELPEQSPSVGTPIDNHRGKIQVLNFGTFHMGTSSDMITTDFDEKDNENLRLIHALAGKLAKFKPTIIVIESEPENDHYWQDLYDSYLENPNMTFENPSEIELLAFEVGRLAGVKRINGIDHKMGYNYLVGNEIENRVDPAMYKEFYSNPDRFFPIISKEKNATFLERLKLTNTDKFLDFLITLNADALTHAGSANAFEGADEAAKFYKRNLRMYSNLNRLDLTEDDKVLILLGATHTAFMRDFMSRSIKYNMVPTLDYLK